MSRIRPRTAKEEHGAVFTIVAIVLPVLLMLTAGGITGFTLYTAKRELQRAADQAALAGAASLPPFDPRVIVENSPFPIPDTDPYLDSLPLDVPRMGDLVKDPRVVACTYGSAALGEDSASLTNTFEDATKLETPLGDDGTEAETVCDDLRVYPRMETGTTFDPIECANTIVREVAADTGVDLLDPDVPEALDVLASQIQQDVNAIVNMPLNRVLPAALSPRMHVDVYSYLQPPLLSFITRSDGGQMQAGATAHRRIKNAVVVPILPLDQVAIETGLKDVDDVLRDPVNLNRALNTPQADLIAAIDDADHRLDDLMASYGEPCQHILHNIRQDLRDIYDPPTGPAPSALDIVDSAVAAAEATSARTGVPTPDPDNPDSLAGEAFYLIGVSVDEFMQPVSALQIPILDVALVVMDEVSEGNYEAGVVSAINAQGLFRATLVE